MRIQRGKWDAKPKRQKQEIYREMISPFHFVEMNKTDRSPFGLSSLGSSMNSPQVP